MAKSIRSKQKRKHRSEFRKTIGSVSRPSGIMFIYGARLNLTRLIQRATGCVQKEHGTDTKEARGMHF